MLFIVINVVILVVIVIVFTLIIVTTMTIMITVGFTVIVVVIITVMMILMIDNGVFVSNVFTFREEAAHPVQKRLLLAHGGAVPAAQTRSCKLRLCAWPG